ncbi:MAG: poly-beta-1,6-N-acetyl-D-glucosamine N-deacetylase PgaB [Herbaspirillum sp.]
MSSYFTPMSFDTWFGKAIFLRAWQTCLLIVSLTVAFSVDPVGAQTIQHSLEHAVVAANDPVQSFRVLCYHDVRDDVRSSFDTWPESTAVDIRDLTRHLSWLKESGYHPVSMQQIVDARAGRGSLPEKAVLLTFDDGYESVYTHVFPLLKQFQFPAVIAIVGDWIETPAGNNVRYGEQFLARDSFANWSQVREMVASGLIEVASHSHSMHHGILANPQGNLLPAATTRRYNSAHKMYESDSEYAIRVKTDLKENADLIERKLGLRPRVMVWPYGAYNLAADRWATEAGMPITMNLDPGPNTVGDSLNQIHRSLVSFDTDLPALIKMLREPASYQGKESPLERVIHVDLDYVYDPDPVKQEENLSTLLDRMLRLRPTTVYLQAFADPDGDGVADALYFPNRHLPMRADLFSRVAWQLQTRIGVSVYAWMPVMAFKLPVGNPAANHVVQVMAGAPPSASQGRYHRLSPFDPLVRKTIAEIYEDLGKHAVFTGILFHDDATFSDFEDASPMALKVYRDQWHLGGTVEEIRKDPALRRAWTRKKSEYLNAFTVSLANTLREYQPAILTARNIYAQPILNPESEEWFAQNFSDFLGTYDFVAVMAMPYMEQAADPQKWLNQLFAEVKTHQGALRKTVFELQSRDWLLNREVPSAVLAAQLRQLHLAGARNFGYYPDDFLRNHPKESVIKPVISVETNVRGGKK